MRKTTMKKIRFTEEQITYALRQGLYLQQETGLELSAEKTHITDLSKGL
jgi:hypothetical protein